MNDVEQPGIDSGAFRLRNGSLGLSLRFSPQALAALTAEIGAGFVSVPRRGAEVGGILAGQMAQQGSEWNVTVDQISPVPIEYQYGPSWRLSAADKQNFQQLVRRGRQTSQLIGWYRSNTRPAHEPEETDRQTSRTFFGAQSIFLFCEPSADGQIHATCIMMLPRGVEVAFAFELGRFSRIEALFHSRHDEGEPAPAIAPPHSTLRMPRALASTASLPAEPPPRLISRNVKIAAVTLALVGTVWYARGRVFTATAKADAFSAAPAPSPAPAPGSLLGLRADYQKDSLLIGWNRNAPEVASAASATFRIADAGQTRTLDLSARELQNGSIVYKPNAEEISVELNITSRNGATASQSIRIVGATVQPRSPTPQAVAHENPITRPPRAFQPPPDARQTETRAITTPDIPLTNAAPNPLASTLPSLSPSLPEFAQSRREFHPAEPVHSPQPLLPADVRLPDYAYDRPLQIQVEVTVGLDGRVTAARLTGESGAWAGLLGPTALNAARMWRFRPAMLGGEPIRSTMVLTFRYARPR